MNGAAETPWNWCPTCKQAVDLPEPCFDGSECKCHGCGTTYVATAYDDESWELEPREPHQWFPFGTGKQDTRKCLQCGWRRMRKAVDTARVPGPASDAEYKAAWDALVKLGVDP